MPLTEQFAILLKHYRDACGMSQDQLASKAALDRSYIGQLERREKSPTLETLEKLSFALKVTPAQLIQGKPNELSQTIHFKEDYLVNRHENILIERNGGQIEISSSIFHAAVEIAHKLIDQIYSIDLDIAAILGPRNLSAFVGELFGMAAIRASGGIFIKNPHQDGYPDLLLMDKPGQYQLELLKDELDSKAPFSPFAGGGIEIKATCGAVPTPAALKKRKLKKPTFGETRISFMTGYDWKAHHRDTNNLIGLLWDFIEKRPRIVAVFYSSKLNESDWVKIVQSKEGGGRTTSVSIMHAQGIKKMYEGWVCVYNKGDYINFLNRYNGKSIIK